MDNSSKNSWTNNSANSGYNCVDKNLPRKEFNQKTQFKKLQWHNIFDKSSTKWSLKRFCTYDNRNEVISTVLENNLLAINTSRRTLAKQKNLTHTDTPKYKNVHFRVEMWSEQM